MPWVTFIILPVKYLMSKAVVTLPHEYFLGNIVFWRCSVPAVALEHCFLIDFPLWTFVAFICSASGWTHSGYLRTWHLSNDIFEFAVLECWPYSVLTNVTHKSHLSPQYTVEGKLAEALLHFNVQMRYWWISKQHSVRTVCNCFVQSQKLKCQLCDLYSVHESEKNKLIKEKLNLKGCFSFVCSGFSWTVLENGPPDLINSFSIQTCDYINVT